MKHKHSDVLGTITPAKTLPSSFMFKRNKMN